ncbi:hypothetical protein HKCCE2091_13380 [Rhodobacterales bacterium HKCCE2091]|nr:hypothetical protein [Rhodobacterales bacterium HKCCE2091]
MSETHTVATEGSMTPSSDPDVDASAVEDGGGFRVRLWLALSAGCMALFLVCGMTWQRWQPWLEARGFAADGIVAGAAFEIVGAILIVGPLGGLIAAIGRLGRDAGEVGADGRITLRIREGGRRFNTWATLAMALLFFAGAWLLVDMGPVRRGIFAAAGVLSLGFGWYLRWAHVIYDDRVLIAPRIFGKARRFYWDNLTGIAWNEQFSCHTLTFQRGRKTSISSSYAGANDVVALAERKLAANARTARS